MIFLTTTKVWFWSGKLGSFLPTVFQVYVFMLHTCVWACAKTLKIAISSCVVNLQRLICITLILRLSSLSFFYFGLNEGIFHSHLLLLRLVVGKPLRVGHPLYAMSSSMSYLKCVTFSSFHHSQIFVVAHVKYLQQSFAGTPLC